MIKYKCENCNSGLETNEILGNKSETCPECGCINRVPLSKEQQRAIKRKEKERKKAEAKQKWIEQENKNKQEKERLEQEQLKRDQHKREQWERILNTIITTTHSVDGYHVSEYIGTVSAFSISKLDFVAEFFADIGDWLGGKSRGYAKRFADLQSDVEAKLKYQTVMKGGNAIIGAKFDVEFIETNTGAKKMLSSGEVINRKLIVSGAGTVVIIE